jgi:hypothetical protein
MWIQNTPGLVAASGGVAVARPLPPAPLALRHLTTRALGQLVQSVEHGETEQRDQVHVPLGKVQPGVPHRAADVRLPRRQLGQQMHEHVRHRDAPRDGQPRAPRRAAEEAHGWGEQMDEREGERGQDRDDEDGWHGAPGLKSRAPSRYIAVCPTHR